MSKKLILAGVLAMASFNVMAYEGHAHHHESGRHHMMNKHPSMTHIIESKYNFNDTIANLKSAIESKGMTIFAMIDHQEAAQKVGLTMQPATVIVFGTPKAGTPLMVKDHTLALQLPLRVLITEVEGKVQVLFNDTRAIIHGTKIRYSDVENNLVNAERLIRATVSK